METKQRNNDVYNHPQSMEEMNKQVNLDDSVGADKEQKTAMNPNPRANENVERTQISPDENRTSLAGSEITDGEDG